MIVHNDLTIGGGGEKMAETADPTFFGSEQTLQGVGLPLKFKASGVKIATSPANPCKFDPLRCNVGKKLSTHRRPGTDFH